MPIELTTEEQTKFQEHLKELGYDDHAKKVIERLNGESKAQREAREKLEGEVKTFRDAEAARKAADDKRAADEAKAKEDAENAKKTLDQRLDTLEKKLAQAIDDGDKKAQKAAEDARKEVSEKIEKRDAKLVRQAIRAAAEKRGIIDPDIADYLDRSKVKVDDGEVDDATVEALIDEHAKAKPHLYKSDEQRRRDSDGRFTRPDPERNPANKIDWSKLSDKEFEEQEQRLRGRR